MAHLLLPRSINTSTQLRAPARRWLQHPALAARINLAPTLGEYKPDIYWPETMSAWLGPTVWMLPMVYVTRSRVTVVTVVTVAAWMLVSPVLAGGLLLTMLCNHPLSTLHRGSIHGRPAGRQAPAATSLRLPASTPHPHPAAAVDTFPGIGGQWRLYNHSFHRSSSYVVIWYMDWYCFKNWQE